MTKNTTLLAIRLLEEAGMEKCGIFQGSHVLYIPGGENDECVRFFSPQIVSNKGKKKLVGLLGSMRKEALVSWKNIQRLSDYFLISGFSANFPELRDPPALNGESRIESDWCNRIVYVLRSFPISQQELDDLKNKSASIHGFDVKRMLIPRA